MSCPRPERQNGMYSLKCSIAVKKHYAHGNSYDGKHLIGACLQFRDLSIISMVRSMVVHRKKWCWRRSRRVLHLDWQAAGRKSATGPKTPTPSNKATPPNPPQVVPLPNDKAFKYMSLWGPYLFKLSHFTPLTPLAYSPITT